MQHITRVILILIFFLFNMAYTYAADKNFESLIKQAEIKQLYNHPYWQKLLHYKQDDLLQVSSYSSEVISSDFFLSQSGSSDSQEELNATITALVQQANNKPDTHAQCRFIARYKWLRKQLDWSGIVVPKVECEQFKTWSRNNQIDSISLIFATGYLSNPASYFGHVLLKFNSDRLANSTMLLDESLNFGATIPENENGLIYLFKGLFGGYEAGFTAKKFYKLNHVYIENDLRDLWEYKLYLTKSELNKIVYHSWELLGVSYDYFFLKENCAYRMAELLALVVENPLLPNYYWSNPVTIFENLAKINRHKQPLVQAVTHIPSRQNRFYDNFSKLSKKNQIVLAQLVTNNTAVSKIYTVLNDNDKVAITNTLIDYYEFLIISDKKNKTLRQQKQKYLIERVSLPIEKKSNINKSDHIINIAPPHEGPLPMMLRLGTVYNSQFKSGAQIQFRPVYYDLLEIDKGRIPNSSLTIMDFKVAYYAENLKLQSVDFVKVETLNVAKTPLPGDSDFAWNFKLSLERYNLSCDDCLITNISGGVGKASSLTNSNGLITYGMFDVFINSNYQDTGTLGIAPRVGLILSYSAWFKTHLSYKYKQYLNGSELDNAIFQWETRFGSNRNWDIRINYEKQLTSEYLAAVSVYW